MGLDVLFCGINPGVMSAETGHHFANPTNHFWRALHQGGLVPHFVAAEEDHTLPERYNLGLTNLIERPSIEAAELSAKETVDSVPAFLAKIARWRPRIVCFVGKGIWLAVQKDLDGKLAPSSTSGEKEEVGEVLEDVKAAMTEDTKDPETIIHSTTTPPSTPNGSRKKAVKSKDTFEYGLQPYVLDLPSEQHQPKALPVNNSKLDADFDANPFIAVVKNEDTPSLMSASPTGIDQTLIWAMPSTSGRVVSHQLVDKIKLFAQLKQDLDADKARSLDISKYRRIQL